MLVSSSPSRLRPVMRQLTAAIGSLELPFKVPVWVRRKALASVAARHLLGSCLASAAIGLRVAGAGASPVQIGRLRGAVGHRVLMPASRGARDLHPYGRVLLSNLGTARGKNDGTQCVSSRRF